MCLIFIFMTATNARQDSTGDTFFPAKVDSISFIKTTLETPQEFRKVSTSSSNHISGCCFFQDAVLFSFCSWSFLQRSNLYIYSMLSQTLRATAGSSVLTLYNNRITQAVGGLKERKRQMQECWFHKMKIIPRNLFLQDVEPRKTVVLP